MKSVSIFFLGLFSLSLVACSTGTRKKLRAPNEDFSYRVKGTDETGKISRASQQQLFQTTKNWVWPIKNLTVTSAFGNRQGDFHDGLDLRAAMSTPIFSVSDGKVIYAGSRISGYGNMIVVKHEKELSTVYAHNQRLLVKKGDEVRRGELIAYSGNSGRSSGPHLHFEVRLGVKAINPLYVLPKRGDQGLPTRVLASSENPKGLRVAPTTSARPVPSGMSARAATLTQRSPAVMGSVRRPAGVSAGRSNRVIASRSASTPSSARVVSSNSRISQSAAVRPVVRRRFRVDSVQSSAEKDLKRRRLVRNASAQS
jgi:hypothetical protein